MYCRIQTLRKKLQLDYTDRIRLGLTGTERLLEVAREHRDYITGETLCAELEFEALQGVTAKDVVVGDMPLCIYLVRL